MVAVDDVGLTIGGILPDRKYTGQVGIVDAHLLELAARTCLGVRAELELEALGIDRNIVRLDLGQHGRCLSRGNCSSQSLEGFDAKCSFAAR